MKKGFERIGRELLWQRVRGQGRTYTLKSGTRTLATLRRERLFGTLSSGEADGRRWTLKRIGFLRPLVTVRPEGAEVDEVVFQPRWTGGGELVFSSGRRFTWCKVSFWRQEWAFTLADGKELVRFRRGMTMSKARVNCAAGGTGIPELPLLLLVGWYLLLLMADDDAAIAAS